METKGNNYMKILVGINIVLILLLVRAELSMGIDQFFNMKDFSMFKHSNDLSNENNSFAADDKTMRICYFQADSIGGLEVMSDLKELGAEAQKKAESKMRSKEREIQRWQESWGDLSRLLPAELRQYQNEAQIKEQEISRFQQQVQNELAKSQEELLLKMVERVSEVSKIFAEENDYDYVFSYQAGQNLYYGSPTHDVTAELIGIMKEKYK